jgi:CRISPR-associated protein Cas2
MIVLVVERVPASLRGELTRWLLEPKAGVFVGKVSAMVRDKLWERVCKGLKGREAGLLVYSADTEQGFAIRAHGETSRLVVDLEGLTLIKMQ